MYIPGPKDKLGLICDGYKWVYINKDELINIMYDKYEDYIYSSSI